MHFLDVRLRLIADRCKKKKKKKKGKRKMQVDTSVLPFHLMYTYYFNHHVVLKYQKQSYHAYPVPEIYTPILYLKPTFQVLIYVPVSSHPRLIILLSVIVDKDVT